MLVVVIFLGFLSITLILLAVWLAIRLNSKLIQWAKELEGEIK